MDTKPHVPSPRPQGPAAIVVTLTAAQQSNLLAFLQRAQLSGKEVAAYNEVYGIIQRARPVAESTPPASESTLPQ
jgi:hypothetical protein